MKKLIFTCLIAILFVIGAKAQTGTPISPKTVTTLQVKMGKHYLDSLRLRSLLTQIRMQGVGATKVSKVLIGTDTTIIVSSPTLTQGDGILVVDSIVSVDGTVVRTTGAQTITDKRFVPRVTSPGSASTITPDANTQDVLLIDALATNLTIANPTGVFNNLQTLEIAIRDNGVVRTITWGSQFGAGTDFTLPTVTVVSKWTIIYFQRFAVDGKWYAVGMSKGF